MGIGKLRFDYEVSFLVFRKSFRWNICYMCRPWQLLTSVLPLFKWCPSLGGFIFFFPFSAPLFSLKFSPRVSWGVCSCFKALHPLGASFSLFKDHYYFTSFSSFRFVLALFNFFDGVSTRSRLGFFFRHVQINFHPFSSPFSWKAFMHNF